MKSSYLSTAAPDTAAWRDHVVLCGLGSAGVRIAEGLRLAGVPLVLVDNGPDTQFRRDLVLAGVPLIEGDCSEEVTLEAAGVRGARAVIAVVNNDLISLRTALAARELNTQARIVARLFNLRIASHLRDLPAGITAISLSATAAPLFTLAARCRAVRGAVTIDGRLWALGSLPVPHASAAGYPVEQWRRLGLVVLGGIGPNGEQWLCPAPSLTPPAGSTMLVLAAPSRLQVLDGGPDALARALASPDLLLKEEELVARQATARHTRLRNIVRASRLFWIQSNALLRLALVALLALVMTSIVAFHFALSLGFVDAVYFTITLVTTVGLGDFNLMHAAAPLKLFGAFVMLGGATLMAVLYGLVAEFVLNQRLDALIGERVEPLENHYIIAGLGTIGFRVASELHQAGEQVVVIESSDTGRFVPRIRELGIGVVIGDAALEETLRRARIAHARAFIAVTSDDLVNIDAALNATALGHDLHVVCRVFDLELARQIRRGLGIISSFSASQIGAPAFISAALGHEVPQVLRLPITLPDGRQARIALERLRAMAGDDRCGHTLDEIVATRGGIAVAHVPAGNPTRLVFAPSGNERLTPDDVLVLACEDDPDPQPGEPAPTLARAAG